MVDPDYIEGFKELHGGGDTGAAMLVEAGVEHVQRKIAELMSREAWRKINNAEPERMVLAKNSELELSNIAYYQKHYFLSDSRSDATAAWANKETVVHHGDKKYPVRMIYVASNLTEHSIEHDEITMKHFSWAKLTTDARPPIINHDFPAWERFKQVDDHDYIPCFAYQLGADPANVVFVAFPYELTEKLCMVIYREALEACKNRHELLMDGVRCRVPVIPTQLYAKKLKARAELKKATDGVDEDSRSRVQSKRSGTSLDYMEPCPPAAAVDTDPVMAKDRPPKTFGDVFKGNATRKPRADDNNDDDNDSDDSGADDSDFDDDSMCENGNDIVDFAVSRWDEDLTAMETYAREKIKRAERFLLENDEDEDDETFEARIANMDEDDANIERNKRSTAIIKKKKKDAARAESLAKCGTVRAAEIAAAMKHARMRRNHVSTIKTLRAYREPEGEFVPLLFAVRQTTEESTGNLIEKQSRALMSDGMGYSQTVVDKIGAVAKGGARNVAAMVAENSGILKSKNDMQRDEPEVEDAREEEDGKAHAQSQKKSAAEVAKWKGALADVVKKKEDAAAAADELEIKFKKTQTALASIREDINKIQDKEKEIDAAMQFATTALAKATEDLKKAQNAAKITGKARARDDDDEGPARKKPKKKPGAASPIDWESDDMSLFGLEEGTAREVFYEKVWGLVDALVSYYRAENEAAPADAISKVIKSGNMLPPVKAFDKYEKAERLAMLPSACFVLFWSEMGDVPDFVDIVEGKNLGKSPSILKCINKLIDTRRDVVKKDCLEAMRNNDAKMSDKVDIVRKVAYACAFFILKKTPRTDAPPEDKAAPPAPIDDYDI